MRRLIAVIGLCLLTIPALCQPTSKYQIGFITEVKPRQATGDGTSFRQSGRDNLCGLVYATVGRNPRQVRERARTASAGRKEHDYLQRHIGSVASGPDSKSKTRDRT